ncbi:hypothetical protein T4D_4488 [Trichinella pseudospiralis]|uniref:Uncharacterized protein n=1 Tax=Trichinella pseudospiralis TaxID=6337 RepID=A0A0V1FJB9_TRIPS|nr:hypothetical protein T4D_4488 [Trichinella pseudospiralis]
MHKRSFAMLELDVFFNCFNPFRRSYTVHTGKCCPQDDTGASHRVMWAMSISINLSSLFKNTTMCFNNHLIRVSAFIIIFVFTLANKNLIRFLKCTDTENVRTLFVVFDVK